MVTSVASVNHARFSPMYRANPDQILDQYCVECVPQDFNIGVLLEKSPRYQTKIQVNTSVLGYFVQYWSPILNASWMTSTSA